MGRHKEKLASFELALRDAGIAPYNLVKISSIFPPNCRLIPREEGLPFLKHGQILHLVMSEHATEEAHRWIQKRSMDTRKPIRHVSEAILLSEELY